MADNKKTSFSFVAEVSSDAEKLMYTDYEGDMLILCLRDNVLFPGTITPINVGRSASVKAIRKAEQSGGMIGVFTQKVPSMDNPTFDDMHPYGVVGRVIHMIKMPDGTYNALIQATNRVLLNSMRSGRNGMEGNVSAQTDIKPAKSLIPEYSAMLSMLKEKVKELFQTVDNYPQELTQYLNSLEPNPFMVNVICGYLPIENELKHALLAMPTELERCQAAIRAMNNVLHLANLKLKIERKTQSDIDQQQREYFLMQEARNIQNELGGKDESSMRQDDVTKLRKDAKEKNWSKETEEAFQKEVAKLERINMQSPDYNVQLQYLQTMVQLPWNQYTTDNVSIPKAEKVLNADHYGMEKVKERILEHLAVLKLRKDQKSPIICLYGPPGVGKTSLGKSIARALKRDYVRISLGGLHDESEIRGHRRTYVGAMPGRIIKGMQKAGSSNPVFILDEIDKIIGATTHGDPSSAMLEVLDPEQNEAFHDNYLDLDYDLSHVMFIATANDINTIPRPLLDRMELIEVGGYITEEKVEIARRHLVPKKKTENGLEDRKEIKIGKPALEYMIERYTRESGVRGLEKQIAKIARVTAKKIALEQDYARKLEPSDLKEYLGLPTAFHDDQKGNEGPGVVTGLAWTQMGGEILFVESSVSGGKGVMTMTGNLGDVMKESATIAYQYIKAHPEIAKLDSKAFSEKDIHVHVPEGATPKDGPSAGITMVCSMASAFRGQALKSGIAMTGEMTLRGRVLPVGGIKEKILAAKRAGVTTIVISEDNRKDIEDIKAIYVEGLEFHYVKTISDVIDFVFE